MALITNKKDRIISFLLSGLTHKQIADIVGCTPAYITNLTTADTDFIAALRAAEEAYAASAEGAEKTQAEIEEDFINNKYIAVEHSLLQSIQSQAASAEMRDLTRALEVVATRADKRAERAARLKLPAAYQQQTNIAVLVLPQHTAAQFNQAPAVQLNAEGEIIAVGNQSMAPMAASAVKDLFTAAKEQRIEAIPSDF